MRRSATEHRAGWTPLLLSAAALYLTAFVLAPAASYLLNTDEIAISFREVLSVSWRIQLGFLLVVAIVGRFARPAGRIVAAGILLALSCLLYLQAHVVVRDYGPMDGSAVDWASHRLAGIFELILWAACLALGPRLLRKAPGAAKPIALAVIVLQSVTISAQLASGRSFRPAPPSERTPALLQLSTEQNVLIFVFDAFQATIFERLLLRDPAIAHQLDGFTYFDNTVGLYPTTLMSIPAILTGQVYENQAPVEEFLQRILPDESLPGRFAAAGYRTTTVTNLTYCKYFQEGSCVRADAFLDLDEARVLYRDCLQVWDVALFRHVPHFLKQKVYEDQTWFLQGALMSDHMAGSQKNHLLDFKADIKTPSRQQQGSRALLDHLVRDAELTSENPVFEFLHVYTTHMPYVLDSECMRIDQGTFREQSDVDRQVEQGACAVLRIIELVDRLRELEILDRTLLVITADHGSKEALLDDGAPTNSHPNLNRTVPLLLVKPPGASGAMRRSNVPASLRDVARTVADLAGLDFEFPGAALFSEELAADRSRYFYDYEWSGRLWKASYLPGLQEYIVTGHPTDPHAWEVGRWIAEPD